jgi:very-short-patch-repair endonuclease
MAWMKVRQAENRSRGMTPAERWMHTKLVAHTDQKWTFQAIWGWRLFDFWCKELGVAVEVDGREHDAEYDRQRDARNSERSAIIVYRVPNFDERVADDVIAAIRSCEPWLVRRNARGILTEAEKRSMRS